MLTALFSRESAVFGPNNSNLAKLISILAEALARELMSAPLSDRALSLFKQLWSAAPPQVQNDLPAALPQELVPKLSRLIA